MGDNPAHEGKGTDRRGRRGHAARGADARRQQAPAPGRRLADDLLPAPAAPARRRARGDDRDGAGPRGPADRPPRRRQAVAAWVRRAALRPRSDLQGADRARRHRAGRRHGRELRRRRQARRLSRRQHLRVRRGGSDRRASSTARVARRCSSRRCPTPSASASSSTAEDGGVRDVVEKAGVVDMRYDAPPSSDAVIGLYCYSPDVFGIIRHLRPSSPRRARDHRREPALRRGAGSWPLTACAAGGRTPARRSPCPRSAP